MRMRKTSKATLQQATTLQNFDQFWAYVRSVKEDVDSWPNWKKAAGILLLEHTGLINMDLFS